MGSYTLYLGRIFSLNKFMTGPWVPLNLSYKWPSVCPWQYTKLHQEGQNVRSCSSYLLQAVYSTHCTNFSSVINKRNVSFSWCIKLQNINISKSSDKFPPNIGPYSISDGKSDFVILIIVSLETRNSQEFSFLLSESFYFRKTPKETLV